MAQRARCETPLGMTECRLTRLWLGAGLGEHSQEWLCYEAGLGGRGWAFLFGGPVGRFVVTRGGELASGAAVGEHGPDLARASAS